MNAASSKTWHDANQAYLSGEIAALRLTLQGRSSDLATIDSAMSAEAAAAAEVGEAIHPPPAVEQLCSAFGLSRFERATLLLCAGVELDAGFAQAVAAAQQDPRLSFPTFGLALAALDEPHWSALSPAGPLRRWRLIELTSSDTLTSARLRIDERVLHYLSGVSLSRRSIGRLVGSAVRQRRAAGVARRTGTASGSCLGRRARRSTPGDPVVRRRPGEQTRHRRRGLRPCRSRSVYPAR